MQSQAAHGARRLESWGVRTPAGDGCLEMSKESRTLEERFMRLIPRPDRVLDSGSKQFSLSPPDFSKQPYP